MRIIFYKTTTQRRQVFVFQLAALEDNSRLNLFRWFRWSQGPLVTEASQSGDRSDPGSGGERGGGGANRGLSPRPFLKLQLWKGCSQFFFLAAR